MTDTLPRVLLPAVLQGGDPPQWVSERGGDVRAHDRREGRLVWGPRHPFQEPSDILLMNGLLRVRVGARGIVPHLEVQAFRDGLWRHTGWLVLGDPAQATERVTRARLERLTPDYAIVALDAPRTGPIRCELRRGERMIRVTLGSEIGPSQSVLRHAHWDFIPPFSARSTWAITNARFRSGIRVGARMEMYMPSSITPEAWSIGVSWRPDLGAPLPSLLAGGPYGDDPYGSGPYGGREGLPGQLTSGIWALTNSGGAEVMHLKWDGDLGVFTVAAPDPSQVLSSPAVDFEAGDDLFVEVRFSVDEGLAITVRDGAGVTHHVSNPSMTAAATTDSAFTGIRIGEADGTFGSAVVDNVQGFMRRHSDAEAEALGNAESGLDALPDSEGDLVFYAPFDVDLDPPASALSTGIIAQTGLDTDGFRKGIAVLRSGYGASGIGVSRTTSFAELAAFVATAGSKDAPTDHQGQYAALSRQELRLR